MIEYKFSAEQKEKILEVVTDHWGQDMQSGANKFGTPYLAIKRSKTAPVIFFMFYPNGQVVVG